MLTPTNPLSARYVAISEGPIAGGDFFNDAKCVAIGVLADGSETGTPEAGTFNTMEGELGISATLSHTYRISRFIKGDVAAIAAIRNAGGVVCAVINKPNTGYTEYGPGIVSSVATIGHNVGSEPAGARVVFGADQDFSDDMVTTFDAAAVIAAPA